MHKCPLSCQISSLLVKQCTKKSATNFCTPLSILSPQGTPCAQVPSIWVVTYSKAPSIKLPNFVPFWKHLYEIFAAKVHRFCGWHDWHTHTHTHTHTLTNKTQTVNDIGCNRFAKPNLNQFRIFRFRSIDLLNLKLVSRNRPNRFTDGLVVYYGLLTWKPNVFCTNFWLCFPMSVTDSYDNHIFVV